MIRRLLFSWLFSKNRFAEAVACLKNGIEVRSSKELYACYRLCLYETVANSRRGDDCWRGGFAVAVSLAACGRDLEASELACGLVAKHRLGRHQVALADALAPFAPELALKLLEGVEAPVDLRAALLLRVGQGEVAAGILRGAVQAGKAQKLPELNLLLSNAEPGSPVQQLARMNDFLAAYALTPLALRDASLPPGQMNLRSNEPHQPVRGPLVSVLMTAFQSGKRIESAITSLLEQTYRDIEVIVVDDAGSDDTGEVVRALAARDPRVVYLRLPCNVGTFVAKSIGLRHAAGEFVTCHDSDDWSHPLRIERQVRPLLENEQLVFTTSHWVRIQDDGAYYARPVHPLMRMNPASPMFRKNMVLERAGGWDAVRTGADSEFLARLKLVFGRRAMQRVVQPLAFGAHRPDSLMTATETGYSTTGMSPTRLAYWEGWGHYHLNELRAGRKPYLPADLLVERRFAAPDSIVVPRRGIVRCLDSCGLLWHKRKG
jgi:glycosyltransferase involved in cell wall biosynthesis